MVNLPLAVFSPWETSGVHFVGEDISRFMALVKLTMMTSERRKILGSNTCSNGPKNTPLVPRVEGLSCAEDAAQDSRKSITLALGWLAF